MNNNKALQNKEQLLQFRKEFRISTEQVHQLLSNPKNLCESVKEFNSKALVLMDQQKWQQSIIILEEAERLLQAATTQGLTIQRYLIQCIFHNEACCYQNLWQLQHCSNYIQALIYNFNCKNSSSSLDENNQPQYDFSSKFGLAKYYLQFCAVNSQLGNHSGALISARKALDIIKKEFAILNKTIDKQSSKSKHQNQQKNRMLNIICRFNDTVNLHSLQILQECTSYYLMLQKNSNEKHNFGKQLKRKIQLFSIKSVMQIQPLTYQNFKSSLKKQNSNSLSKVLDKLFVLSTCYFTMATQLRILSLFTVKEINSQQTLNHPEFKQSFMYHLFSILILALTININSPFLQHLLLTYHNHYNSDLLSLDAPFKKVYNQLIFSAQPKIIKQISIICSDQDQCMGSLISKGSGTLIRFTKSSKQSQRQYKCQLLDPKKQKSKCKKKVSTTIKPEYKNSKGKKTGSSLSKSPLPKSPIPKASLTQKPQKSKESIGVKTNIPSIKQIFGKLRSKMDDEGKKHMQRQKTSSKSKRKGKLLYRINEYFLNKGANSKSKKSFSTKKSTSQAKSSGRLPINSTLQAKQPSSNIAKEKKKSSKKSLLQHYL